MKQDQDEVKSILNEIIKITSWKSSQKDEKLNYYISD